MKKAIALVAFFLLLCGKSYSQENSKASSVLTSGKWRIASLRIGEEKETFSSNTESWLQFEKNGTYIMVMNANKKSGKWELERQGKVLMFKNEGSKDDFNIRKLTQSALEFTTVENAVEYTMVLER